MSMDYQAEDQAFHEEVAQEMKGMAFTSFTGNVYVDAIRTLKGRAEESYQRGVRSGKMLALIQCADLVAALPNEVTVTDYHYRNGWRDACSYAEMRLRALEADVEEKPCRHVCIDCGLAFRPSERCRLCTKGHDREQLRKRRAICQCGNAAKDRPCKMDCPGSEVEP